MIHRRSPPLSIEEVKVLLELSRREHEAVEKFLATQHPPQSTAPMTDEQWEEIRVQVENQVEADMKTWTQEDYQRVGMFEMFGNISEAQRLEQRCLIEWLDQHIDEPLIKRYIDAADSGRGDAIWALERFKARLKESRH